jgi:hypothetical protein
MLKKLGFTTLGLAMKPADVSKSSSTASARNTSGVNTIVAMDTGTNKAEADSNQIGRALRSNLPFARPIWFYL